MLGFILPSFYVDVYFSENVCSDDLFRCQRGRCVNLNMRCDGYNDCGDGSDEKNCTGKDVGGTIYLLTNGKEHIMAVMA